MKVAFAVCALIVLLTIIGGGLGRAAVQSYDRQVDAYLSSDHR